MTGRAGAGARRGEDPAVRRVRGRGDGAALLTDYDGCGIDVIEQSAPYPNRRDPGERVYLTVRIGPGERS